MTSDALRERRDVLRMRLPMIAAFVGGLALCAALNLGLVYWISVGPPAGKSPDQFFLTVSLMLGGAVIAATLVFLAPGKVKSVLPGVFILLAWHTGFQYDLPGAYVISAIDILVPICLFLSATGHREQDTHWRALRPLRRPFGVFWMFIAWGVCVAVAREVSLAPMFMNLKSYVLYPAIGVVIFPWCLTTWRRLYVSIGFLLLLIFERAVEGLVHHGPMDPTTRLANGQILIRSTGAFASVNQYALYLMTGILVTTTLIVAGRSQRVRLALLLPLLIMVVAMVSTLSRGGFLGTGLGLVILALFLPRGRALALITFVLLAYPTVQYFDPGASSRVNARLHTFDNSAQERLNFLALGEKVIQHYPFGAGWGAAFTETSNGDLLPNPDNFPWYHDDYVQLATEVGVLGVLAFAWFWLRVLALGLKTYRSIQDRPESVILIAFLAAVPAMLLQAGTEQFWWRGDIAPHMWMIDGFLLSAITLARATFPEASPRGGRRSQEPARTQQAITPRAQSLESGSPAS